MVRWLVALFVFTLPLLLLRSARADLPGARVPLRGIVTPLPRGVMAALPVAPPTRLALGATVTPVDNSFLGRAARVLDGMRPPTAPRGTKDSSARYPTITDPRRERDATSFGIQSAPLNGTGAAMAGGGLGAAGAQLIDLGTVAKRLPVRFAPNVFQGGGGLSMKLPW